MLKIKMVQNGWLIETEDDTIVFETPEYECEVETFSRLLRAVTDQIGPITSRYSKARISVDVIPGDKYDSEGSSIS